MGCLEWSRLSTAGLKKKKDANLSRVKRYRERIRQNPEQYKVYKERQRLYKAKQRARMKILRHQMVRSVDWTGGKFRSETL